MMKFSHPERQRLAPPTYENTHRCNACRATEAMRKQYSKILGNSRTLRGDTQNDLRLLYMEIYTDVIHVGIRRYS